MLDYGYQWGKRFEYNIEMSVISWFGDEFVGDIVVMFLIIFFEMIERVLEQFYFGCVKNCLLMFIVSDWMIYNCYSCFGKELIYMIDGMYRKKEIL